MKKEATVSETCRMIEISFFENPIPGVVPEFTKNKSFYNGFTISKSLYYHYLITRKVMRLWGLDVWL